MSAACHRRCPRLTVAERSPTESHNSKARSRCPNAAPGAIVSAASAAASNADERLPAVTGAVEVKGQFAGTVGSSQHIGRLLPQCGGDAAVQPRSLRREQVGVDDLAEQRVAEAVGLVVDDQQPRVDHGPHRRFQVGLWQVDDRSEQLVARVATDRRDRPQHTSGAVVEIGDLGGDQIGEHDRDGVAGQVRSNELAREERVAATTRDHLIDERARCRPTEQHVDSFGDLVAIQPFQIESMRRRQTAQLGQSTTLARVDRDLVGPVGADQHHLLVDQVAGEVLEQIPRHRVGPVEVLEPDDHSGVGGQLRDQLEDGDEQPAMR